MSWKRRAVDIAVWMALLASVWLCAAMFLKPSSTVASVTLDPMGAVRSERADREPPRATVPEVACEIQGALRDQPDVAEASVRYVVSPAAALTVFVHVTWACPVPPPPQRLDTIARWVRERMDMPCEVSIVTPETRHDVVYE